MIEYYLLTLFFSHCVCQMSESSCGVSSHKTNANGGSQEVCFKMSGPSGSCSFIKQERIEGEGYHEESRANGDMDVSRHKGDLTDNLSEEKVVSKSPAASPAYQNINTKNTGQLAHQQPDSQSSNNNNSIKAGKFSKYQIKLPLFYY